MNAYLPQQIGATTEGIMQWFWTWSGKCFGYRVDESLYTHKGREVGRFYDGEIYGADGRYLGEIRLRNRLITNRQKSNRIRGAFVPRIRGAYAPYGSYGGYAMFAGCQDFPDPTAFER